VNLFIFEISFVFIVGALLLLDFGVFHKPGRPASMRQNIIASLFYLLVGLLFSIEVWQSFGLKGAQEYLTGFLAELVARSSPYRNNYIVEQYLQIDSDNSTES
jgi:hypothetical protein